MSETVKSSTEPQSHPVRFKHVFYVLNCLLIINRHLHTFVHKRTYIGKHCTTHIGYIIGQSLLRLRDRSR